jgi:hypothetical protein
LQVVVVVVQAVLAQVVIAHLLELLAVIHRLKVLLQRD